MHVLAEASEPPPGRDASHGSPVILAGAVLLVLQAAGPTPGSGVAGVTRAAEDGRPLPGVGVELVGSGRWTRSDSLGRYTLGDLPSGSHRIRFAKAGRIPVEIAALVPERMVVQVDVELSPRPAELAPIIVTARRSRDSAIAEDLSVMRLGPAWRRGNIPGPGELQSALTSLPGAATRGEASGTLNFQGGESDQAGIRVDGFPVLGATHFGSALSAVNPDLVRGIEIRVGAPPARFGGWLSGTILLESSLLTPDSERARGGLNPTDVRQSFRGRLPGGRGRFLLSGRRSFRNLWGDPALPESGNGYEDWLGSAAVPLGRGRLQLLIVESRNQLGFPSRPEGLDTVGTPAGPPVAAPGNNLEWRTGTVGAAWHGGFSKRGTLTLRAWRANTGSDLSWQSPDAAVALGNRFTELAVQADGSWPSSNGALEFGAGVVQSRSRYSSGPPGATPSLSVFAQSTLLTGYLERRWRLGGATSARAGVRANYAMTGWVGFEPRAGLELRPAPWLRTAVEAGRIYQFTQSLRNQESFLSSVVAFDLPAGVGTAGLPMAAADNLSLTVEASLTAATTLGLRGYVRNFRGLLLGAPATAQPFVTASVGSGTGSASGAEIRLSHVRGPVSFDAAFAVASAQRQGESGVRYRPGFLRSQTFRTQIVVAPDSLTTLGLAFQAGNGQPTTLVREVGWRPYDPLGGGEFLGTPDNLDAGINPRRLPGVARLDFGMSRRWGLPAWLGRGQLTTAMAVENLLNRHNPMGLTASGATGVPQTLFARPRTLRLELGWRF